MKKVIIAALSLVTVVSWSSALMLASVTDDRNVVKSAEVPSQMVSVKRMATGKSVPWSGRRLGQQLTQRRSGLLAALKTGSKTQPQVLGAQTFGTDQLSSDQVVDLVKPGVVSIINWMDGELSISDFDVDLKTFELIPRPDRSVHTIKADWNVYGSGFVVNPNGYIVTNAHVVSKDSAYDEMRSDISDHLVDIYQDELDQLSDKEYRSYNNYLESKYGRDIGNSKEFDAVLQDSLQKYIKDNLVDHTTQNIVVIDRSMMGQKLTAGAEIDEVYHHGLPATIVDFDKNYRDTQKDVALVHISEKNVPTLPLGSTDGLQSGAKVSILGFPYNAEISDGDLFEPTFTQGVIGAIKDYKGQKVIQLDNKISHGSSGSPLLDEHGKVLGVVTYQVGDSTEGDSFGYAIPVEVVKDVLAKHSVANDLGVYGTNFLLGVANQGHSYCKKALDNFNAAGQANSHFPVQSQLSKYTSSCQELIASKMSKDTAWDVIRIFFAQHQQNAAVLSVLVLLALVFGVVLLIKLFKHLHRQKPVILAVPRPAIPGPIG